ncbi:MAG: hypothetical protein JWN64_223 [Parcubacteria group bacterium]|nr:hypothetical protein [Parcubacteria group bacterium]
MSESTPKFDSVPDGEARALNPQEISEAQAAIENLDSNTEIAAETSEPAALTPERHAEVMEEVAAEEQRLGVNLQQNSEIMQEAESRLASPAQEESKSTSLLTRAKIDAAYEKTKHALHMTFMLGLSGGLATVLGGAFAAEKGRTLDAAMDMQEALTNQWQTIGQDMANGGLAIATAATAIGALGATLAWLKKRSQEKALYAS